MLVVFFFVLMIVKISTIYTTIKFGWAVINVAIDFALIKMYLETSCPENCGEEKRSTGEEMSTDEEKSLKF